jgi:hypothetical protein
MGGSPVAVAGPVVAVVEVAGAGVVGGGAEEVPLEQAAARPARATVRTVVPHRESPGGRPPSADRRGGGRCMGRLLPADAPTVGHPAAMAGPGAGGPVHSDGSAEQPEA